MRSECILAGNKADAAEESVEPQEVEGKAAY